MRGRNFFAVMCVAVSLGATALACGSSTGGGSTSVPLSKDISGTYDVSGVTLENEDYTGAATITHDSDNQYTITWLFGEKTEKGQGTLDGDTFTGTWGFDSSSGAFTYTIKADGSLDGVFTQQGRSGSGTETLTPKK